MSVLCLNVCRLCLPNIVSLDACFKKLYLVTVGAFASYSVKFMLFSVSGLKEEKLILKQTSETCKLYSRIFWIFLPNAIKIDPYNFKLYRFKVDAFFRDTVITEYDRHNYLSAISIAEVHSTDWIVQCFTSPPTQYRLYGRRFLQVKRPNQQYRSTEGKSTKDKSNNGNNTKQTCIDNNRHE